jgi:hypothetical protein
LAHLAEAAVPGVILATRSGGVTSNGRLEGRAKSRKSIRANGGAFGKSLY